MQKIRRCTDVLNIFVAVFASLGVVSLLFLAPEQREAFRLFLSQGTSGTLAVLAALVTLLLNLLSRVHDALGGEARRVLTLQGDNGTNLISIPALEARLLDVLASSSDVSNPKLTLHVRGEGVPLLCDLSYALHRIENVTGRADEIKRRIREAFLSIIPEGIGIEMNAHVLDLLRDGATVSSVGYEAPSREFSGPIYPIESGYDSDDDEDTNPS